MNPWDFVGWLLVGILIVALVALIVLATTMYRQMKASNKRLRDRAAQHDPHHYVRPPSRWPGSKD